MRLGLKAPNPNGPTTWSASYLAFIANLTPQDVFAVTNLGGVTPQSRNEYRQISFARRLAWCYGDAGAVERLNS